MPNFVQNLEWNKNNENNLWGLCDANWALVSLYFGSMGNYNYGSCGVKNMVKSKDICELILKFQALNIWKLMANVGCKFLKGWVTGKTFLFDYSFEAKHFENHRIIQNLFQKMKNEVIFSWDACVLKYHHSIEFFKEHKS